MLGLIPLFGLGANGLVVLLVAGRVKEVDDILVFFLEDEHGGALGLALQFQVALGAGDGSFVGDLLVFLVTRRRVGAE